MSVSRSTWSPQLGPARTVEARMQAVENLQSFATQNTKSKLIRRIARLVRQDGLDYEGWRYVAKKVR